MRKYLIALICGLLFVGTAVTAQTYTIQRGDTLTSIAERFGTTVDALREENGLLNLDLIFAGAELNLPEKEIKFGSSGIYDKYAPTVADAGISSTDTFLPLSTFTLSTDDTITTSTIHFPAYLVINPDSSTSREQIECSAIDSTRKRFIRCNRAITCNNLTNTTSTVSGGAYAHSAGERVIMSNTGCYFNRFVDDYTSQNVGGTKTFTTSTVSIGDNATTTEKSLVYRVGLGNNTYLKFRGPAAGYTTATALLNLGAGEFELNASGTSAGASSTAAMGLTNGLFHWKASTTRGLSTDNTSGDGSAVIFASSTASNNGGFINFVTSTNALGRLFWDVRSFLAKAWTWLGDQTFNGTVLITGNATTTGIFTVNTPTSTRDAVNKGYLDAELSQSYATGTAGMPISVGQTIVVSTTSTLFLTDAEATSTAYAYVGVALTAGSAGEEIRFAKPGGVVSNQNGLTPGKWYYLSDTAGSVGTTKGTLPVRMGLALSESRLLLTHPSFTARTSGQLTATFNGSTYNVTTNFIPTRVDFSCHTTAAGGAAGSLGWWAINSNGSSSTRSMGLNGGAWGGTNSPAHPCDWNEGGGNVFHVSFVATTTNGFTVRATNDAGGSADRILDWTASVEDTYLP